MTIKNMDGSSTAAASKVTIEDFDLLKVLGKGSFGKVMMVRKKDSQKIYAMKTLRKAALIKRNQLGHTKTERNILQTIKHPYLTTLSYAFQVLVSCAANYTLFFFVLYALTSREINK
jgi:serum/glucocorticoid-regulated kinase 2